MKYLLPLVVLLLLTEVGLTQKPSSSKSDTTRFTVYGNCEMCKERIEAAAKGKGVKNAFWDIDSKIMTLAYKPSLTNPGKVQQRIAEAGHDTELKKAKDAVYDGLPACCLYRHGTMEELLKKQNKTQQSSDSITKRIDEVIPALIMKSVEQGQIKGVVLEADSKGNFRPLQGASVIWLGTKHGTFTDSSGVFMIAPHNEVQRLVISYAGYTSDTIAIQPSEELKIILASNQQLNEVRVSARQRSTYLSAISPVRIQVMTERELFKAACCNLSESFETNPSVDVSYNDAVTGSKQIQLLGLSGNYTQLTVENLPGPRGLATPLGLNFIAGPWVESIQLNKGVGSVVNGYESIAGQINIELKKPEKAERLYLNAYINNMGKTDLNLNLTQQIGKKWSTALLLHDDFLSNKTVDFNKDGFRDLPTGNLFSAVNRWKYEDGKGFMTQFGFKMLTDNRTGGETGFNPDKDKFTTNHYGLGIETKRYEGFAKIGYVFPEKKYKSIGLQLSVFDHQQDSYFGMTRYNATQQNFYANLIYQSIIGSTVHKFRTGLSFTSDKYNEDFRNDNYKRTEAIPGGFFEYTFTPVERFNIVAGIRADRNSLFVWFATPRLHIRYEPVKGTTIRASIGRGQRTANIFAENMSVFVSSRQVNILSTALGKAYRLNPETAWNKGISVDQKFKMLGRDALFSVDFFRNNFENQVVVDLEDVRQVKFYNLEGKSFSNSFQAELHMEPARKLELRLAYRFFDVRTTYSGQLLQKPFTAKHRAFANIAYEISGWKFDYTVNYNGAKRIPGTIANPSPYQLATYSPSFVLMNAQVSKTVGKKHPIDLYIGGENLGNYFQKDVIVAADQPFGPYFDASLVWGPVSGSLFYTGLRLKIK
ncbi:MAG: TonB-dependent receptor [Chitinophagaceae bacterium]|nr:TonB-dependent receptor [Chitinophagaceae bacterium]MBP6416395.1 TonB-dependent receptor [Chitinophagaceae bacterium]